MSNYKYHPYKINKICDICKNFYEAIRNNQKYCKECGLKKQSYRTKFNENLNANITTGTIGTIAELEVCCDLLKKGYEVFRAVSSSCSCDLAILKNGVLKRIEVKTGYRTRINSLYYPKSNKTDIMAIVIHKEQKIIYEPEL